MYGIFTYMNGWNSWYMYVCEYSIHVAYGYFLTGSLLSSNWILCFFFACYQRAISALKTKISPENQCLEPGKHSIYIYIHLFFRQLCLVLGVKLMEHISNLFSRKMKRIHSFGHVNFGEGISFDTVLVGCLPKAGKRTTSPKRNDPWGNHFFSQYMMKVNH